MNGKPILWEELTTADIPKLVKNMKMAIVPLGAIEQHGPHLPMNCDTLLVHELAKRVSAKTGVPVLPPMEYGQSQAQGDFPGTISVNPDTLYKTLIEVCEWLYKCGIRKILLLNGHGMNKGATLMAQEYVSYRFPRDVQIKALTYWETNRQTMRIFCRADLYQVANTHANLSETAMTMAIRPDLVKIDRVVDEQDIIETYWYYRKDKISASGTEGSGAGNATAELGEEILSGIAAELIKWVEGALKEDMPKPHK